VIKRQFEFVRVRYRGTKKNTSQLFNLFALLNLRMMRGRLTGVRGYVRPEARRQLSHLGLKKP
jgi:IS5 family transposase